MVSTSNIQHIQVLSTVSTQFGITECFNNLQTLVCVSSESFQCSFMASTPDFCLKLVCPYLVPLSTVACPEDFHPSWSCLSSPPSLIYTESNYFPNFLGCLVTIIHCVVQLGQLFQNQLRVSIDLTWGMAQFIKTLVASLSLCTHSPKKGSSPEASLLPSAQTQVVNGHLHLPFHRG